MTTRIPGISAPFRPFPQHRWDVDWATGRITVASIPGTDIFTDPGGEDAQVTSTTLHNAATLLTEAPAGDFQLRARVGVEFSDTFDAGALFVRHNRDTWAKLCFEYSPQGEPMIVSVVNNRVSDDANAFTVDSRSVHLRISRIGKVFAFHASQDGKRWVFVRAFAFPDADSPLEIAFEAQSPHSEGCQVTFEHATLTTASITDFRDET
ncbi:hypothetical protein ASF40_20530 [Microbacterium sp. Leaf288]|uniref:DUF1349 domain-containing protein n=1 Tax=Microbacterium sp. Leaf288 TaxID=1736323 RepID=UPI0006F66761|nr:DUF1349 domain-containing protein [Microbacterium sp. Leaf288]KQP73228.1 hypothetical protein ASF40_20530 [Microbacterium sp. Leaf288]